MNKLIIFFIVLFLVACGGGGGSSSVISTPQDAFDFDSEYEPMWNFFNDSYYHQRGDVATHADINLSSSWNNYKGSGIKVAIIDSCFDTKNHDLHNIIDTFNAETNTTDVSGIDCHGTEVAGILAGAENGWGIVGVAPNVDLYLIKVPLDGTNSSVSVFINAFEHARDQNVSVINCSWGSNDIPQALADELNATKNDGIIIVFASGNEKKDLDDTNISDESEEPSVIGVGATGKNNDVTNYSNYGSNIDFLAPGGDSNFGVWSIYDDNRFARVAGTSFSAPTVAGLIARMLEQNSSMTFDDVYNKLKNTADKVGLSNGANYVNGFDKYRAYGKINAGNALK